ncbi:MAG: SDR family oxidoreductase [Thermodesulfovibrionales bacterium]
MNSKISRNNKKTVLVTGATSGIGYEISKKFAQKDWNVLCHYNSNEEKAQELKEAIVCQGVECYLLKADLSKEREIKSFAGNLREFQIDSLINNAGTYIVSKHFSELTMDDISKTFVVNVFAPMFLTFAVFLSMKERRFGRIVNISSIAAKYGGSAFSMHYGCSKRAIEGMTKTLAKEGAAYNVLVNTIRPGVIDTEFHKKFPKDMKKRIEMIPLRRMGMPNDVADMAYYLGSDVNKFITNEIIAVAGGE